MNVVFTDLDGSLLDLDSHSFEQALPAIRLLERLGIPVIFSTSKTRAEVEELRGRLGNAHPFIVENGGAAFVPRGYFPAGEPTGRRIDGYDVFEFGAPYGDLVTALGLAARKSACSVRGFHDMSEDEIAACCGLSREEAGRAKQRNYDEPFQILDPERAAALLAVLKRLGWRCTRGDAWYHLTGNNDKALAAQALLDCFRRAYGPVTTVGVGDGPNDAVLLSMSDVAFIVRSPMAAVLQALVPAAEVTTLCGAAGWNEAALRLLKAQNRLLRGRNR